MDGLILLVLLLAMGEEGGGASKKASPGDDDPPDDGPPPDDDDTPPKPANACGPDGAYYWDGFLAVPPGGAATYGLTPAEYSAAMTVLTRVENQVYKPDFDTGGASVCNQTRVQAAAKIAMTPTAALAMLAYWKIRNRELSPGEKLSPFPGVDPALAGITMQQQRKDWTLLYSRLRAFFVAAEKAGEG